MQKKLAKKWDYFQNDIRGKNMTYTLPDGQSFKLDKVLRVSKIRDEDVNKELVQYSTLYFNITLADSKSIVVSIKYLYSDWAEQKKKLTQIREDVLKALQDSGLEVDSD